MPLRFSLAVLCAALVAWLAGCASPEELRRQDEATCRGLGFQQGTADFSTCLQRESLARRYSWYGSYYGSYYGPGWYPVYPGASSSHLYSGGHYGGYPPAPPSPQASPAGAQSGSTQEPYGQ